MLLLVKLQAYINKSITSQWVLFTFFARKASHIQKLNSLKFLVPMIISIEDEPHATITKTNPKQNNSERQVHYLTLSYML